MNTKKLFFFAIAALGLAACSNDEVVEINQSLEEANTINFRSYVSNLTRYSAPYDMANYLASFKVTAFMHGETTTPYINDVTYVANEDPATASSVYFVDGSSASTNKYRNEYYWPDGSLDFYAYAYNASGASQINKVAYNIFQFTPNATAGSPTQTDLIYATNQDVSKGDPTTGAGATGVSLNFRHTASKVAVKVYNTSQTLKFEVDAWKIGYLDPTGTFTLSETSTAGSGTLAFADWVAQYDPDGDGDYNEANNDGTTASISTEYSSTFTEKTIAKNTDIGSATVLDGDFIVVPQAITAATAYASAVVDAKLNNTFVAVKLKIRNDDGNGDDSKGTVIAGSWTDDPDDADNDDVKDASEYKTMWAIWPLGGFNLEPGKKYTISIDLADGGYYELNQDTDTDLDPILENAIIKFATVTVDTWTAVDQAATQIP